VSSTDLTFPLVPRWRPAGSPFGRLRAARRGLGTSVAGNRPYRPGDSPGSIDWKTSARLSAVRGETEFIVREHFADEAPRLVAVLDRRPSMQLFPDTLPWLQKPSALRAVWDALAAAALRDLGLAGCLDLAGGTPAWFPPTSGEAVRRAKERVATAPFDAPDDALDVSFTHLSRARRSLPPGTFVFVCSDFLVPPAAVWWLRAHAYRWDAVPVVIQDPLWEQSFPALDGLVVPFADPVTGRVRKVRLGRGSSAELAAAHASRLERLLGDFRSLGLDPVVIGDAAPAAVLAALTSWAEARLARMSGEW
jgi:uncharacterized protein (DUF58 family)